MLNYKPRFSFRVEDAVCNKLNVEINSVPLKSAVGFCSKKLGTRDCRRRGQRACSKTRTAATALLTVGE